MNPKDAYSDKPYKQKAVLEEHNFGGRFTVQKILVERPDGKECQFYLRTGQPFAIVIPVLSDGSIVMVNQHRIGANRFSLEFPMGQVDGAEGEEIARIELKEETGYDAGQLRFVKELYPSPGWSNQKAFVYTAHDLVSGVPEPEDDEFVTAQILTIAQLEDAIDSGVVFNIPTIAAYYIYKRLL